VVGLKTDYVNSPPIGDSRYVHPIAIAAAGEEGGVVSLFEAVGERRSVRLIVSDNERGQFVMLKDAAASRDRELVGALTPLGTIWGLDRLAVLAWEQGYDGGRYSIVTITAEGLSWMISAGARGC